MIPAARTNFDHATLSNLEAFYYFQSLFSSTTRCEAPFCNFIQLGSFPPLPSFVFFYHAYEKSSSATSSSLEAFYYFQSFSSSTTRRRSPLSQLHLPRKPSTAANLCPLLQRVRAKPPSSTSSSLEAFYRGQSLSSSTTRTREAPLLQSHPAWRFSGTANL